MKRDGKKDEKEGRTAQNTIAMGLNSHMAHFTLNPWDIPTARDQTELVPLFAVPLTHSVVCYDGYYAVTQVYYQSKQSTGRRSTSRKL